MAQRAKSVALAVQGGGAHGAFSWGVLDRLLDEVIAGRLKIAALSGTSAGAINATIAAYGLGLAPGADGAAEAKRLLRQFWWADAGLAALNLYSSTAAVWHAMTGNWNIDDSPAVLALDIAGQMVSPSAMPAVEWLQIALGTVVDFDRLRAQDGPELYVTTTNITHNRRDIFAKSALSYDVLAASACLPHVFPARPLVMANGKTEYYWDGGFMGNPAISPLCHHAADIIVLQINAFHRPDMPPRSASAIADRVNEITFNAALVLELSSIAKSDPSIHLHAIADEPYLAGLGYASKFIILKEFLEELRGRGRAAADRWLETQGPALGRRSTLDMQIMEHIIHHDRTMLNPMPGADRPGRGPSDGTDAP